MKQVETPADLPNPHLARYIDNAFYEECPDAQIVRLRTAQLEAAGLPNDYQELTRPGQQQARIAGLTGWFDPRKPDVLCTSMPLLISGMFLYNEWYMKPAQRNQGIYFNRDPTHKYRMVEQAMSPPLVVTEPAKTLLTAPRGSIKTQTLIQEMVPFMALTRPNTEILVCEINGPKTDKEMGKIGLQIESNEYIHRDFGTQGKLWPASNRWKQKWTTKQLDFCHLPRCSIYGKSFYSALRGEHPILWIIDDPEDRKTVRNREHRKEFLIALFRRGMGMMARGSHVLWITTLILGGVCHLAMYGKIEEDEELADQFSDVRFDDWRRENFDLLIENDDGTVDSIYPDYLSPEAFEAKCRTMGRADAMAEYRGVATAEGELAFVRDPVMHAFMRCTEPGGEYFLDLVTGQRMPWDEWLSTLHVCAGCDPATSTARDSDYGASICIGVDPLRVVYVLDALLRKCIVDTLVTEALELSAMFGAVRFGIEAQNKEDYSIRLARRIAEGLSTKKQMPVCLPISTGQRKKELRIISGLRTLYESHKIRFLRFEDFTDSEGKTHTSATIPRSRYYRLLLSQLDCYTDEGAGTNDDGPDALEIAVRVAGRCQGEMLVEDEPAHERTYRELEAEGIKVTRQMVPPDQWSRKMWSESQEQLNAALHLSGHGAYVAVDPYEN